MPFSVKKIKGIDTSNLQKLGDSVVDLAKYTEDEFSQVASALQGADPAPIWNAPLPKPRRGTTIYADGTHWNPGSGEGPYWFDGANYHPMGQGAITDAPSNGNYYGRQNGAWQVVVPEAPNDGQNYVRKSLAWAVLPIIAPSPIRASLGADVAISNSVYTDGPSIAQGAVGTWWVSGTITFSDSTGGFRISSKLWDGTTIISSAQFFCATANAVYTVSLSGFLATPAGNLRISATSNSSGATSTFKFNSSGNSRDSTISAYRIS